MNAQTQYMHSTHIWYLQTLLFSSYCEAELLPKAALQSEENPLRHQERADNDPSILPPTQK